MRRTLDRAAASASERIIHWMAKRVDPSHREWIEAMGAELHAIDGGWRRLLWVAGGLRLAWSLAWRREVLLGQRGLPMVGSTCAFSVVLAAYFWLIFTRRAELPHLKVLLPGLAGYFFAAGFLAGPATKGFVAGALIGLTSGLFGVFGGFVIATDVVYVSTWVYELVGATGILCGGLGAVLRAHLHRETGVRVA